MPVSRDNVEPHPPHGLGLVIEFVNTLDLETLVDQFDSSPGLTAWLVEKQLLDPATPPIRGSQRRRAIRLREALRALMLAHNGLTAEPEAARELEDVARRGRLAVHFATDGSCLMAADAEGVAGALARVLVPVIASDADGTWRRAKGCRAADCHWVFYDHSRNRSGVWCDMAVCGNRTKVRAYRRRKPGASARV
jgi:predicted RNA-binding Zn ribbon-like protein